MAPEQPLDPSEARWPAVIAIIAVGGLYAALPASLVVGPRWLFVVIVAALLILTIVAQVRQSYAVNNISGHLLVRALPAHVESPVTLLRWTN
jgi:hypothetical protein